MATLVSPPHHRSFLSGFGGGVSEGGKTRDERLNGKEFDRRLSVRGRAIRSEDRPVHASVCHCRMCQKASGGPLMAFARVKKAGLRWTRGQPAGFRSSSLVDTHF